MHFVSMKKRDGSSVMVSADGKELGTRDVTQKVFHILPKLLVPAHFVVSLKLDLIEVFVASNTGVDMMPAGGEVVVRQPYPNQRYFVGGSNDIRNGWIVPLPDDLQTFDLEIRWVMEGMGIYELVGTDQWEIRQNLHITLEQGSGNTFSMDSSYWPVDSCAGKKIKLSPIASLESRGNDRPAIPENRDIVQQVPLFYPEDNEQAGICIEENLIIPGIKMDQAWSIDAFQDEQLHELVQVAQFANDNAQHQKNTSVEFPAKIFIEAVRLAQEIDYEKDSEFAESTAGVPGAFEQHPANKLLSNWWAVNRPQKTSHEVGFAMPWVRVRDDGYYWCGHYETPNARINVFEGDATAHARIGDTILLMFFASHKHFVASQYGIETVLANGSLFSTIGVDYAELECGNFDEAWYSLEALAAFPVKFPAAWKQLQNKCRNKN